MKGKNKLVTEIIQGKLCDTISKKMTENIPFLKKFQESLEDYKTWAKSLNTGNKHELFKKQEFKMKRTYRFRETDSHEIGGHHNNLLRGGGREPASAMHDYWNFHSKARLVLHYPLSTWE